MKPLWIISSLNIITAVQCVDFTRPSVLSVKSGERITFNCPFGDIHRAETLIWYKQTFGELPLKVGERLAYNAVKISPIFKTIGYTMELTENGISLTITHIKKEHEGLYYCETIYLDIVSLSNGTFVSVSDEEDVKVSVIQDSVLGDSALGGSSVCLQCSVLSDSRTEELQVLWFRAAPSQSHPQIIYTHHNSRHQCERGTCVYNFSKNISLNDIGTYYCAVAVSGKIVFGKGTRVQLEISRDHVVIYLSAALGVCVVVIFAYFVICIWRSCEQDNVKYEEMLLKKKTKQSRDAVELNFADLHIIRRGGKRGHANDNVYTDVIYSSVS